MFPSLLHDEMSPALLSDLDECITSHILYTYTLSAFFPHQCQRIDLPSCVSCINSNSLLTTVFKNFQWALRNRGYCPTMYMMSEAQTALLSFPRFISVRPKSSLMTVTKNRFSVSSSTLSAFCLCSSQGEPSLLIAPEIDPIAQQSVLRLFQLHSDPSI